MKKKIIFFAAHHDDIELGCGGTALKYKKIGYEINYVIFTKSGYKNEKGKIIRNSKTAQNEAKKAEVHFNNVVVRKGIPEKMQEFQIKKEEMVVNVIFNSGLLKSKGEVRRMIKQNAIKINDELVTDINKKIEPKKKYVIKVGKRKFLRITT